LFFILNFYSIGSWALGKCAKGIFLYSHENLCNSLTNPQICTKIYINRLMLHVTLFFPLYFLPLKLTHLHTHTHKLTYTQAHTLTHSHTHKHTLTHSQAHIHTSTHTHSHTYTRIFSQTWRLYGDFLTLF